MYPPSALHQALEFGLLLSMKIIRKESLTESSRVAVERIVEVLRASDSQKPLVVGLCGGRSVGAILDALAQELRQAESQLRDRLHFFVIDERMVPLTSEESNYALLNDRFFRPMVAEGILQASHIHPFTSDTEHPKDRCAEYLVELQECGGELTIVVLGMGEDGHVAGTFPHHSALSVQTKGFVTFTDSPKPPAGRMTATLSLLRTAKLGVLLALGEGKRAAFNAFQDPTVPLEACPAKICSMMHEAIVVTDL